MFGIRAERAGRRMRDRHFGQRAHQQQCDQRADRIGHEHARAGEPDRETAAEKESRADRAADRDHRHLPRRQRVAQPLFALDDVVERLLLSCHCVATPCPTNAPPAPDKTKRRGELPAPFG